MALLNTISDAIGFDDSKPCGDRTGETFLATASQRDQFAGVIDTEEGNADDRRDVEDVADTGRAGTVLDGAERRRRDTGGAGQLYGGHSPRGSREPYLLAEHGKRILGRPRQPHFTTPHGQYFISKTQIYLEY